MPDIMSNNTYLQLKGANLLDLSVVRAEEGRRQPGADMGAEGTAALKGIGPKHASELHWQGVDTIEQFARSDVFLADSGLAKLRNRVRGALGMQPVQAPSRPAAASRPAPASTLTVQGNGVPFIDLQPVAHPAGTLKLSGLRDLGGIADNDTFWDGLRLTVTVDGNEVTVAGRDIWDPAAIQSPVYMMTPTRSLIGSAIIKSLQRAGIEARWGKDVLGGTLIHVGAAN